MKQSRGTTFDDQNVSSNELGKQGRRLCGFSETSIDLNKEGAFISRLQQVVLSKRQLKHIFLLNLKVRSLLIPQYQLLPNVVINVGANLPTSRTVKDNNRSGTGHR